MPTTRRRPWLPVLAAVLLGGILWSGATAPASTAALPVDGDWLLMNAQDQGGPIGVQHAGITLSVAGGEASGYAGCGEYRMTVSGSGSDVAFGVPVDVQSAPIFEQCAPELEVARDDFLAALSSTSHAMLHGKFLHITGRDVELVFRASPRFPEAQLSGTSWVLERYGETWSGQQIPALARESTLRFLDDGKISAVLSCRTLLAFYRVSMTEVSTVSYDLHTGPEQYCPRGTAIQDLFVSRVLDEFRATVRRDRLTLTRDRLQLVYRLADESGGGG